MEPWNIRRRKALDAQLGRARAIIADREEVSKMVEFEHRTDAAVRRRLVKEQADALKKQMADSLRARRAK